MKRAVVLAAAVGVALGCINPAEAAPQATRTERTVEVSYGPYPAPLTGCNSPSPSAWKYCMTISPQHTEAFFTAKVTDDLGLPVFAQVVRWDGREVARFCGGTSKPLRIDPMMPLNVYVGLPYWGAQTTCPTGSVKTSGSIQVTLSNLP